MLRLPYAQRAELQTNAAAKKLLQIMEAKQSNLSLSLDVTSKAEALRLADIVGPKLCLLKTHIDIIEDADAAFIADLTALAKQHNFLIFEDRKFADVGNTVKLQYESGPFKISSWADFVNFHLLPGPGILDGLIAAKGKAERGFIVLSQMSSKGNLFTKDYSQATVALAEQHPEHVIGFICQNKQTKDPRFLHLTPGVNLASKGDALGQQYRDPTQAIVKEGCDIIIVGRGIIEADNPLTVAEEYRVAGWDAYQTSLG